MRSRIFPMLGHGLKLWPVSFCLMVGTPTMDRMNNIADIYHNRRPISFEMFPPKGALSMEEARSVALGFSALAPDFISVTYSAGGSGNNQATAAIASMIQDEFTTPALAHLTCLAQTRETLRAALDDLQRRGITAVLALRGDPPQGLDEQEFANSAQNPYRHASDLIPLLVDAGFTVAAAAYPEGHISCSDDQLEIEHLKLKQDLGASFLITQLFFDNDYYYRFRERAERTGITLPMSCGIMPFLSKGQITRMVFTCGASLPSPIIKLLARFEHDPLGLRRAGIDYACRQLEDLAAHGVDGLHIYAMNSQDIAAGAMEALESVGFRR